VGQEIPEKPRHEQRANIVAALKAGAPIAEEAGVTLVLEPLNVLVNHKGYYLATSAEAFDILREVDSPNVKLLFDIYHQQITEGNLIANITANIGLIGHFHAADNPGRNELGTGEINYANVFKAIAATGYAGYVGLEYLPLADPAETLRGALRLLP
jgi:hydroxypyruvate isomerase